MRSKAAIYYTGALPVRAGGELVNFQHVAALRRLGWRAFMLLDPRSQVGVPRQPYAVPMVHWGEHLAFGPDDWLVVPEVTPPDTLARLARLPCRVVIHNQNPFYTFRGFADVDSLNAYPLAGGLCCSHHTRDTLVRWGSATDWQVVRPAVLPHFARAATRTARHRQIAYMPRKRPDEVQALRALFRGLFPQHAQVPWVEIHDMSRPEVARLLAASQVFASLGKHEGLGLPPLEALAAGCQVCGYDGGGGREYASTANGRWVADGDLEGFARALDAALNDSPDARARQVQAGQATAAEFSEARFERELAHAWLHLTGSGAARARWTLTADPEELR